MDQKVKQEAILTEISKNIHFQYKNKSNIGLLSGISGCAIFQFYYSKYTNVDTYSEMGIEIITHCIDEINKGYSIPTYADGIAGTGWAIQHLNNNGFIDINCDELLQQFDEYLYNQMKLDSFNRNYDFLHGAIGYGFFFLSRYKNTRDQNLKSRYENYLFQLLVSLEKSALYSGEFVKWKSILSPKDGTTGYNFGLSHGIPSIVGFLSRLSTFKVFTQKSQKLINGSISYLLSHKNKGKGGKSLFPSWIMEDKIPEYDSRLAWCYGDLGVGISLLHASNILKSQSLEAESWNILEQTSNRKDIKNTEVLDAAICHGSFGNAQIYKRLVQKKTNPLFELCFEIKLESFF